MDWWLITFFSGALLSLFLPIVPSLFYLIVTIVLTCLVYYFNVTRFATGFILGCVWMIWSASCYQSSLADLQQGVASAKSNSITVFGEIASIAQYKKGVQRFNFIVKQLDNHPLTQPLKIRLAWQDATVYKLNQDSAQQELNPRVKHQQLWRFKVRIKPAHGLANPGGFSYQTWLRRHGIHGTGYVVADEHNQLVLDSRSLHQHYYDKLTPMLEQHPLSGIVYALTFGERSQLTAEHWQILKQTATVHLVAISGLHLGLVAAFGYAFFSGLLRLVPLEKLLKAGIANKFTHVNNKYLAIALTLLLTAYYAYLAGFSLPTMRAFLMLMLFWVAKGLGVKLTLTRWLTITLVIILLCYPMSLISISFWLSFYAVGIIFLLLWRFQRYFKQDSVAESGIWQRLVSWCARLFALQLGLITLMLPLTVLVNHQLSIVALPANLLAVPWMSITSIPLSLLSVLMLPISSELSLFLVEQALKSIELVWQWLGWLSSFSLASVEVSHTDYLSVVFIVVCVMLYLGRTLTKTPLIAVQLVVLLLITALALPVNQTDKQWQVNVMDVGQGLAVVVEANHQVLVYDTGASFPSGFSMAETVLVPYLKTQGYQALDLVIISHDDNDHSGGLAELQQEFFINRLIYNQYSGAERCQQGQRFYWQFLSLEVLSPKEDSVASNDDSCVIKISDGLHSVLLTGDISQRIELQLVKVHQSAPQLMGKLASNILVVPHHGSKSSSSPEFISAVAPEFAIFSSGFLNRWQMPTKEVVERYHRQGVTSYNTAEHGMLRLNIGKQGIKVQPYRQQLWPFWFAN